MELLVTITDRLASQVKGSYKSMTMWFNTIGLSYLQILIAMPELKNYLSENEMIYVWIIGNIILRFKTTKDLADK